MKITKDHEKIIKEYAKENNLTVAKINYAYQSVDRNGEFAKVDQMDTH